MDGLVRFCKKNYFLFLFTAFWVFISFSAKIFLFTIGLDTEWFIADRNMFFNFLNSSGRVALPALLNLWQINYFNPFYTTLIGFIFLTISIVSWLCLVLYFDNENGKKLPIFAFAAVSAVSPIWAEWLQFQLMCAELFFCIFITPFVIIMLFEGFEKKIKKMIVSAIILMAFIICVYQSFVILFIFGFAVGLLFMSQRNNFDSKLPLKIFIAFLISLTIYWLVGKLSILVLKLDKSQYIYQMNLWDFKTIKDNLLNIFGCIYILTFAKVQPIHSIISSVFFNEQQLTQSTGVSVSERIFELSTVFGSVILFPLVIIFLIYIFQKKNKINKFVYFSAGILIPLSVLLLAIFLGNKPPLRTLFTLPFVLGFLFYFIISRSQKNIACFFAVLSFIVAINSSQISSALFYSDSERFRQDVFLAQIIDLEIKKITYETKNIALIGKYEPQKSPSYIRGEIIGFSEFEFVANGYFESSIRGIYFMKSLGMNYEFPDSGQMEIARKIQKDMPSFPESGFIKDCGDFIVVKLHESSYKN